MNWIRVICLSAAALLVACGFEPLQEPTRTPARPTAALSPIVIQPTNTPLPPPPTPTTAPTATPLPPPTATSAPAGPTAAAPTAPPGATTAPTPVAAPALTVEMIEIPAGAFTQGSDTGSPEARPARRVEVAAFRIDKLEVTNADFAKFVAATGYRTDAEKSGDPGWKAYAQGKDNHPVVKVSWNDAAAFCQWAGKRLPTESEWEKAARGTDGRVYPWGNDWDPKKTNGKDSGFRGTLAVGSLPAGASPFGVMDLAGNVAEWTADLAAPYPGNTAASRLYGPNLYILRGGGWFSVKEEVASFARNSATPSTANDDLGFRCAK